MKIFVQSPSCPSQVLFAFDEVADAQTQQIRWAVAYSTRRGCERLVNRISARIGQPAWAACAKFFITSVDFGLTDPTALEFLGSLPQSHVFIANADVIQRGGLLPNNAYHPKLYLFDTPATTGYVVGSANLTDSALITNTEVVTVGREPPDNCRWDRVWDEVLRQTEPLTDILLDEYRRKWLRPQRRSVDPEPRPALPRIQPESKAVFWEAVTARGVDPMAFHHFWVEAGSMSSGGSHNQLELPRGANRFFGFVHARYGQAHTTIGHPILTVRGMRWTNRPLTWHGHNKMERINLPTVAQGGFEYRDTAVLFRRHAGGFEVNVLPWNDDGAVAWRAASEALATVFRLGAKGGRICGLF